MRHVTCPATEPLEPTSSVEVTSFAFLCGVAPCSLLVHGRLQEHHLATNIQTRKRKRNTAQQWCWGQLLRELTCAFRCRPSRGDWWIQKNRFYDTSTWCPLHGNLTWQWNIGAQYPYDYAVSCPCRMHQLQSTCWIPQARPHGTSGRWKRMEIPL